VFLKINFELPISKTDICFGLPLFYKTEEVPLLKVSRRTEKNQVSTKSEGTAIAPKPIIRPVRAGDVAALYAIECESFCSPYEMNFFHNFPRKTGCIILVAVTEIQIGGYIACQAKRGSLEVVSLAVGSHSRRRGLGFHLMNKGFVFAQQNGCQMARLHVSIYNFIAQELYRKMGFQTVGSWIKEYYHDEHEDAMVMECPIPQVQNQKCSSKSGFSFWG